MVEDASGTNVPMVEGRINVRFRRLQPEEDRSLATCNILVMEYCDRWACSTLDHAARGLFLLNALCVSECLSECQNGCTGDCSVMAIASKSGVLLTDI
jgi:hypothetical protein